MMQLRILKLGGSVVTHKDQDYTAHIENIKRLSKEIAEASQYPLIIVHGGGSFGHPHAKKYGIADGLKDKSQIIGFSGTHQAMVELNKIIVDALLEEGVPAFSLSASSMIRTDGKRLNVFDPSIVQSFIELGMVPVLYGDAVLDTVQGFAILSGDQLIAKLALAFKAKAVIFGSDVDGIFTDNPKLNKDANLIETVSVSNVEANVGDTTHTDVTGGMLGKLSEAAEIVNVGSEVLMLNAFEPGRVKSALLGEKVIGTKLTL
jgi:isopentenyl phosphate kinase